MPPDEKKIIYPQNIYLKGLIAVSGQTVSHFAKTIKVSRRTLSLTINGHYKGDNVVPKLLAALEATDLPTPTL
jgi:DNA transposition AAA+ family ATPase